jgi:preprotein translocase subunit Sec63
MDEIRRSYLSKIKEFHPDRVAWLAPELLELAERRARTLNAAYTEAMRERRENGSRDSKSLDEQMSSERGPAIRARSKPL